MCSGGWGYVLITGTCGRMFLLDNFMAQSRTSVYMVGGEEASRDPENTDYIYVIIRLHNWNKNIKKNKGPARPWAIAIL